MKRFYMQNIIPALLGIIISLPSFAVTPNWLHIFTQDGENPRVTAFPLSDIDKLRFLKDDESDDHFSYISISTKNGDPAIVKMDDVSDYSLGTNVPSIYINTDEYVEEVSSKVDYLSGEFYMEAFGAYDDVEAVTVNIRGRGNTTWNLEKKPYRLKFDKKISLCGLKKAKNYVLIANYIDNTLMRNAIALKIGELLGMPYTNHSIPVNVYFNGIYKGAYMLSEKVGINSGSVDIDEEKGFMFELDTNFDEDYKFYSRTYNLPVMVKDPDPAEIADVLEKTPEEILEEWREDFERMEEAVKAGSPEECIDIEQAAKYLLTCVITANRETNHPKSVNLYKTDHDSKWVFGPIWDFDWAFNYYDYPYDLNQCIPSMTGGKFFHQLASSPAFVEAYEREWDNFKDNLYPQLLDYMDEYAEIIRVSALQNGERWQNIPAGQKATSAMFDSNYRNLREYLINRVEWLSSLPGHGI